MDHILFDEDLQFELDRFGIPEPIGGEQIDLAEIDMILVPLLVFDRTGNRIGYGGGYYDRLLVDLPERVVKVGLSLAGPVDLLSTTETHDIALDACITPFQIVKFK